MKRMRNARTLSWCNKFRFTKWNEGGRDAEKSVCELCCSEITRKGSANDLDGKFLIGLPSKHVPISNQTFFSHCGGNLMKVATRERRYFSQFHSVNCMNSSAEN